MQRKLAITLGVAAVLGVTSWIYVAGIIRSVLPLSRPTQPLPTTGPILEARAKATQEVRGLFQDLDAYCAEAEIRYYDTATLDLCYPGRHDWKVDAIYENRCRYVMTHYYGFSGDFRTAMASLDSGLVAAGWERHQGGLPSILAGHYDRRPDPPKPESFPGQYTVSSLPAASYHRGPWPQKTWPPPKVFRLFVRCEERDTTGRVSFRFVDDLFETSHREARTVDTDTLFPTILESNRYVLELRVMADDYFVN